MHRIFIDAFQWQVAVFYVTLQNTLTFEKLGYTVTDRVNQIHQFLLIWGYGALESRLSLFVFCIYTNVSLPAWSIREEPVQRAAVAV